MPVYKYELDSKRSGGKPSVRWQAYRYDKNAGRNRYLGTFATKAAANEAIRQEEERIRLGRPLVRRRVIGFSDLVDEWMSVHVSNLRPNTINDYEAAAKRMRHYFKNVPVDSVERRDVALYVSWLCKQPLGVHTVRKFATRLTQVFNFAIEFGYIDASPTASGIKNLPKLPRKRIQPLTPAELRSLLDVFPELYRPMALIMATAGLRRSEAFGLTTDSIDLERGELRVTHQLVNGRLVEPKTENAVRVIPLAPSVVEALRRHLEHRPANELDLLFPTESGTPIMASNFVRRVWAPAVEASGIGRHITMHDLRRTYGSMTARHGRSAAYLQATMGHSNARTSLTYYVGIYGDEQQEAVADVEKWLGSEPANRHPVGQFIALESAPDYRNTEEEAQSAA
ncbi:MAG: site-specific integrase [Coriobacteriia bacterium]|nr:site-specific integrase [Coriobacteriia bacterium]